MNYFGDIEKDKVEIVLTATEAAQLLQAALDQRAELGDAGSELADKLKAAGIAPPPRAAHRRSEYMPPAPHIAAPD